MARLPDFEGLAIFAKVVSGTQVHAVVRQSHADIAPAEVELIINLAFTTSSNEPWPACPGNFIVALLPRAGPRAVARPTSQAATIRAAKILRLDIFMASSS
jgi:hypothetical protein